MPSNPNASLPSRELAREQSQWLRGARSRLFRQANITRRKKILELGAGWGDVSMELADRSGTEVLALDRCEYALQNIDHAMVQTLCGDAHAIPLDDDSVDLVVTQFAFLWFHDPSTVVGEIGRILKADGAVACIEPDFGGLMEYPDSVAIGDVWLKALLRNHAHPHIGRRLPGLFSAAGFRVDTMLLDRLVRPLPQRFKLLSELSLTEKEAARVQTATQNASSRDIVHLPHFLLIAEFV